MDIKNAIKIAFFISVGIFLMTIISIVIVPKWNYSQFIDNIGMSVSEFHDLKVNPDVFFLGTSHMVWGVSPMLIYEDNGIVTYNIATCGQPIECTYYFAKEIFEKGYKPKLIVIDASSLFTKPYEALYRYITDLEPLSWNKVELVQNYYISHPNENELNLDRLFIERLSFFIPFLKYHSRWTELNSDSFKMAKEQEYFTQGQNISPWIRPSVTDELGVNIWTNLVLDNRDKSVLEWHGNQVGRYCDEINDNVYQVTVRESNCSYISRIKEICDENDCELLLVKIPVMKNPQDYTSSWNYLRHNNVEAFCKDYNINFLDLTFDEKLDMDFTHDSSDEGAHLNLLGAEKVSHYLGNYIVQHYYIKRRKCSIYDKKLEMYKKLSEQGHILLEYDFSRYLNRLSCSNMNLIVMMSAKDDMRTGLSDKDMQALKKFGLKTNFDAMKYTQSFLATIDDGKVVYEVISNRRQGFATRIDEENIMIESAGNLDGNYSSIIISNQEYSLNGRGINIVVYDKESKMVIDRSTVDTWSTEHEVIHDPGNMLYDYNEYLLGRE